MPRKTNLPQPEWDDDIADDFDLDFADELTQEELEALRKSLPPGIDPIAMLEALETQLAREILVLAKLVIVRHFRLTEIDVVLDCP